MITVPNMIMIGGNSRNAGKTTLACRIISKLSASHEIIGIKVTGIRPGEEDLHGSHDKEPTVSFDIFEEVNPGLDKDTSKMLKAGAARVFYIRVADSFMKEAILHFLSTHVKNQLIVCESRSLREIVTPGLSLMMMRLPVPGKVKDVSSFILRADKVFYFGDDQTESIQFVENLDFINGRFIINQ